MFVRYRSDYANQVHQLLVSVSRHLFITSADHVRYQKKPFTFTLDNVTRSPKEHVVHYLIRDHFSGHFYAEVARSTQLIAPEVFLMRAWRQKEGHSFCGAPDMITVPASVARAFPRVMEFISMWGIKIIEPTSGFQAGVRDLQTWEQQLRFDVAVADASYDELRQLAELRSFLLSTDSVNGESKLARWRSGLAGPLKIPTLPEE